MAVYTNLYIYKVVSSSSSSSSKVLEEKNMKNYTTICLDIDIALKLRKKDINLSGLINNYLRNYLSLPKRETEVDGKDVHMLLSELRIEVTRLEKKRERLKAIEDKGKVIIRG